MRAISIHAPPRGATGLSLLHIKWRSRFQFTPLREGRRSLPHIRTDWKPFQFTPLREGRRRRRSAGRVECYFNSRPSARGDVSILALCANNVLFQFTPLREGRRINANGFRHQLYFNSRPSARGDGNPWEKRTGGAVLDLSEDKVAGRADHDQLRPALQYHPFVSLFAR